MPRDWQVQVRRLALETEAWGWCVWRTREEGMRPFMRVGVKPTCEGAREEAARALRGMMAAGDPGLLPNGEPAMLVPERHVRAQEITRADVDELIGAADDELPEPIKRRMGW